MNNFRNRIFITSLFLLLLCAVATAQRVEPHVTVNLDKTPDEYKSLWSNAGRALEQYLAAPWHDNPFDYSFPLNFAILIDQVIDKPPDRTYKAFLMVSNGTETQFSDKRWQFPQTDLNMIRRGNFEPLGGLLEFYTFLALAEEFDKWDPYGGELYYTRARSVVDQGKFDSRYVIGWSERSDLLSRLVSVRNKPYRLFRYYTYTGSYLSENNPSGARAFVDSAFVLLDRLPEDQRHDFLSLNTVVLADAAFRLGSEAMLTRLSTIDTVAAPLCRDRLQRLRGPK